MQTWRALSLWVSESPHHGALVNGVTMALVWFCGGFFFYPHQLLWEDAVLAVGVGVAAWAVGLWFRRHQ